METVGFCRVGGGDRIPSERVFARSHRPAVVRIAAPSAPVVASEMVELRPFRDGPDFQFVSNSVSWAARPFPNDARISGLGAIANPYVATILVLYPPRGVFPPRTPRDKLSDLSASHLQPFRFPSSISRAIVKRSSSGRSSAAISAAVAFVSISLSPSTGVLMRRWRGRLR